MKSEFDKKLFNKYSDIKQDPMMFDLNKLTLYRDIVVLYCPSKVGSTSIATSIRLSASDKFFVFHTHTDKVIDIDGNELIKKVTIQDLIANTSIYNKKANRKRKIYIIDIYRTSIERKISEFFQYIGEIHFNNLEENIANYPIEKIINRFNNIYMHMDNIDYYNEKFDVGPIKKFDFEKKYFKYENNGVTYIKLRLTDSELWDSILSEILETEITMVHDYSTDNKKIGELYKKFKETYLIPCNFFNSIIICPQLKLYYTSEERNEYLSKWDCKKTNIHIGYTREQFLLYMQISKENKFFNTNYNNHYGDDGCVCDKCSVKRKKIISNIKLGKKNILNTICKHTFDKKYDNVLLLKVYGENPDYTKDGNIITINYVNFF